MIVVPFKLMDIIISLNVNNLSVIQLQIRISELKVDQRKNLRSNSDKIVSLPTRIKKEYNGNKRLSSPSSGRNS